MDRRIAYLIELQDLNRKYADAFTDEVGVDGDLRNALIKDWSESNGRNEHAENPRSPKPAD